MHFPVKCKMNFTSKHVHNSKRRKEPFKTTYVSYRKSLLFNEKDREWLELVCNNSR